MDRAPLRSPRYIHRETLSCEAQLRGEVRSQVQQAVSKLSAWGKSLYPELTGKDIMAEE
jgi:hypothetical protein